MLNGIFRAVDEWFKGLHQHQNLQSLHQIFYSLQPWIRFNRSSPPVPSCHATRRKHGGWDTASLPKPRGEVQRQRPGSNHGSSGRIELIFSTDISPPFNHDLFEILIVKNEGNEGGRGASLPYCNHFKVPTPQDTHSGNLDNKSLTSIDYWLCIAAFSTRRSGERAVSKLEDE
ncbi:hypothetical protein T265_07807 [Opisthorchis viverrini]|uniref:Uncharacterized protein n=1 Tax=Opisthorchis viverrini TaxID=6198 RepID=A0A074ZFW1_OPIVI|nr:hypothetical protein T265_07807 [Opisthorchis viverrini]KER24537.1 hypothetical protein T265_07807 [Opisthorchis viverrini]